MRIRLTFEGSGLQVIPQIPNFEVTHLEGRNGIGKSLAVRLLQVVSGQSPYRGMPLAWESLRRQLTTAKIQIDSLRDGETIEVDLTPQEWPDEPAPIRDERLGSVRISGEAASVEDLQSLICVHRVAGDETLSETLAQAIDERRLMLSRVAHLVDERVEEWDFRFEDALSILRGLDPSSLAETESKLDAAVVAAAERNAATTEEGDRVVQLEELVQHAERLRAVEDDLPKKQRNFQRARQELVRRESALAERNAELRAMLDARNQSKKTREELQHWSALLRRRQTALQKVELELSNDLRSARTRSAELVTLNRALRAAETELGDLTRRRSEIDQIRPALDLQRQLSATLDSAVDSGRASTVVAYIDRALNAHELRAGVERRTHELEGQPRPGEIQDLDIAINQVRGRIAALTRAPATLARRDRAKELYDEAVTEIASLAGRSGPAAEARLQQLQASVAVAQERLLEQRVEIVGIEREVSELEASVTERLAERVAALEQRTGIPTRDAPSELLRARQSLEARTLQYAEAESELRVAESRRQSIVGRLALTTSDLQTKENLSWLRPAWIRVAGPLADISPLQARGAEESRRLAQALDQLERLLRPIADMASDLRNALTAGSELLGDIAGQVRERGMGQTPTEALRVRSAVPQRSPDLLRREIERDFSDLFGAPQLLQELFGGTQSVRLDLRKLTVHWTGADGGAHQRPLEAFSSGEQAFAYTLAKLEALAAPRTSKYVLLVLDEFGAFVARDRLTQLFSYVQRRALGRIADSVVIVLPLAQDYVERPEPESDDGTNEAEKVRQVHEQGYFAVPAEYILV